MSAEWEGWNVATIDWHFHRRLYERHGVILQLGELALIRMMIRIGDYLVIHGANERGATTLAVKFREDDPPIIIVAWGSHLLTAAPPCGFKKSIGKKLPTVRKKVYHREHVPRMRASNYMVYA